MCQFNACKKSQLVVMLFLFVGPNASDAMANETPKLTNWIDERFEQHFNEQGKKLSIVDDATFLRRVYLDLSGRIPTISQIRDFTANVDAGKRVAVIDMLLEDERFPIHTARIWRRILMPPSTESNPIFASTLDDWLREQLQNNTRFDKIASRLVTAGGADVEQAAAIKAELQESTSMGQLISSPTAYLQHTGGQPANMASSVSRVFLGVRLECAQCHDHPFTDWKQQDFWGVAAFFAGAKLNFRNAGPLNETNEEVEPIADSSSTSISDADGNSYSVSLPWDGEDSQIAIPDKEFPRQYFARWMTSADNPHFAATAVNRVWQHLCGKGLTDSVDDLDLATAEQRDVVLDGLANRFIENEFDLKALIRSICASKFYQRTSEKTASTTSDIAARPLKVMTPEQLFDSYEVAVALPISSIDEGPRFNGERESLVSRMEEALGERPDEFRSGIPQALSLMNGKTTADATDLKKSRTLRAVLDAPFLDLEEKVDTLFLVTLSRVPHKSERTQLLDYINDRPSDHEKAEAFSEVMWALINSPEFVLVR